MAGRGIVAIVGAGPYGLSLAAHLAKRRIPYRIFGQPMRPWQHSMPPGMLLKSDGASSSLSHPDGEFPIERFYRETGRPFLLQAPISVDTFVAYGEAFQRRFVPAVDTREVVEIIPDGTGYAVHLAGGEIARAGKVVLAVGVTPFSYIPPCLSDLSDELVTHSAAYGLVDSLRGREVAVIGSGASAIDLAVALHEHGAYVRIVSRRRQIAFQSMPSDGPRSLVSRIRAPDCGIGAGWKIKFCADLPGLFHALPERRRIRMVTSYLGPSPGWFTRDRVLGRIPISYEAIPETATQCGGRVHLILRVQDGSTRDLSVDHVIAATGYKIDVRRFGFLAPALISAIRTTALAPALSRDFETSVPGLYVIGPAAAMSFGPVMRFVVGADFAVRRLAAALARSFDRQVSRTRLMPERPARTTVSG
jgi:putative flavoprotein involved in K+ transport